MAKVTRIPTRERIREYYGQPLDIQHETTLSDLKGRQRSKAVSGLLRYLEHEGTTRTLFRFFQRSGIREEGL